METVDKNDGRISPKAHAHLQTMTTTYVKFKKISYKTVRGVAPTSYPRHRVTTKKKTKAKLEKCKTLKKKKKKKKRHENSKPHANLQTCRISMHSFQMISGKVQELRPEDIYSNTNRTWKKSQKVEKEMIKTNGRTTPKPHAHLQTM